MQQAGPFNPYFYSEPTPEWAQQGQPGQGQQAGQQPQPVSLVWCSSGAVLSSENVQEYYPPNASTSQGQGQRSFMNYPSVPSSNDGSGSSPYAYSSPQPNPQQQQQNLWLPKARPEAQTRRTNSGSFARLQDSPANAQEVDTRSDCIAKGIISHEAADRYVKA